MFRTRPQKDRMEIGLEGQSAGRGPVWECHLQQASAGVGNRGFVEEVALVPVWNRGGKERDESGLRDDFEIGG